MFRPLVIASLLAISISAVAQEGEEKRPGKGTGYTYYGLRKLELDSNVSDEEKLKEWQAFLKRTDEQVAYAKKAVERWKNAARLRVIEAVQNADKDPNLGPRDKMERWDRLAELYPKTSEASLAKKRSAYWRTAETKRLVEAADKVERSGAPKFERVRAWVAVLDWVDKGPEAKAAQKRIDALQEQLFSEAQSLDKIARVDAATKLAVWKDVLKGSPSAAQKKLAEQRIAELEAQAGNP